MSQFDFRSYFSLSAEPVAPIGTGRVKGPAWHVCGFSLHGAGDDGYVCSGCGETGWLVAPASTEFAEHHKATGEAHIRLPSTERRLAETRARLDAAIALLTPDQRREAYARAREVLAAERDSRSR